MLHSVEFLFQFQSVFLSFLIIVHFHVFLHHNIFFTLTLSSRLSLNRLYISAPYLTGADGATIAVQNPDLPTVFDLVVMDTVASAVVSMWASAVVAPVQVEAHSVVGAGVSSCLAFVNVCVIKRNEDSHEGSGQIILFMQEFW